MMSEVSSAQVSVGQLIALGFWFLAFGLVAVSLVTGAALGDLGVLFGGIAVCMTIRVTMHKMFCGERSAFEVGRDAGRAQGCQPVRVLR